MSTRRERHNAAFIERYLQARRMPPADTSGRGLKGARRQLSDKRAVEAVARALRGGKA